MTSSNSKTNYPSNHGAAEQERMIRTIKAVRGRSRRKDDSVRRASTRPSHSPAEEGSPRRTLGAVRHSAFPPFWTGANSDGDMVIGVAASTLDVGFVEILAVTAKPAGSYESVRRELTPRESRQLADHLMAAADEAERREALQLVATA